MTPFPNKKYEIIYADPPWSYNVNDRNGSTSKHYDTLSLEEIKNLPIRKISKKNCLLFIWVTFPCLKEGLETIEFWGFRYVTVGFSWIKLDSNGFPFIGVGNYTRANAEICLIGVKGKAGSLVTSHRVSSVILSKIREHSRKPDEARNRIVQLVGDRPRIELFSRSKFEGWDVWGNEVPEEMQTVIKEVVQ